MATWYAQAGSRNINAWSAGASTVWFDTKTGGTAMTGADFNTMLGASDVLCANNQTALAISASVTCGRLSTTAEAAGDAGGGFTVAAPVTITADITAGTSTCVVTSFSTTTLTMRGNITGGQSGSAIYGLSTAGSMIFDMIGNITGGAGTATCYGVYKNSTGTFEVTGVITGGTGTATCHGLYNANGFAVTIKSGSTIRGGSGTATCYGFNNASSANATITATIEGGSVANTNYGFFNSNVGTVNITGNCTGGSGGNCFGAVVNSSTGAVNITGDVSSGSSTRTPAIYNISTGVVTIIGKLIHTISGGSAIWGNIRWTPGVLDYETWGYDASNSYYYAKTIPKASVLNTVTGNGAGAPEAGTVVQASVSDVKLGVLYGPGGTSLEGILDFGDAADVAAAIWSYVSRSLTA